MGMIARARRLGLTRARVCRPAGARRLVGVAVMLLLALGSACGLLVAGPGSASAQVSRSLARGPAIPTGHGGYLYGISCMSAASCWAVGTTGANLTEALHWNGHGWAGVTTPSPGDYYDVLAAVTCTSSADCWAVGTAAYGATFTAPNLALHWDGHNWSVVATPSPWGGQGFNELQSVTCTSPTDCWAVGSDSAGSQALHWDGHLWSLVSIPQGGGLAGVTCTSSANCWAVGLASGNQVLHWDGHQWSVVAAPAPGTASELNSISCTSAVSCWAVGAYGAGSNYRSQILYWNGHQWSLSSTPTPRGSIQDPRGLGSVACTSPGNCWAAGPADFPLGSKVNEALHWNGHDWSYIITPSVAAGENPALYAVTCTSSANCWAVGSDFDGNQAIHWNGHKWSTA